MPQRNHDARLSGGRARLPKDWDCPYVPVDGYEQKNQQH